MLEMLKRERLQSAWSHMSSPHKGIFLFDLFLILGHNL